MTTFDISLDHRRQFVKVVAIGELFQTDGEKLVTTARQLAADHNYNVFYDIREATTKVAFASWYTLPRNLEVFKDQKARSVKAAVLVSENDQALEGYEFYSVVTENLGIKVRIFFEESEALEWLAENLPERPLNDPSLKGKNIR